MNLTGYDVATPGNHDFDWGLGAMRAIFAGAAFPYVSANLYTLPADTLLYPAVRRPPAAGRAGRCHRLHDAGGRRCGTATSWPASSGLPAFPLSAVPDHGAAAARVRSRQWRSCTAG